jgi:hypothetical protein
MAIFFTQPKVIALILWEIIRWTWLLIVEGYVILFSKTSTLNKQITTVINKIKGGKYIYIYIYI